MMKPTTAFCPRLLFVLAIVGTMVANPMRAQDPGTTQFYAALPHLNPAFAGGTLKTGGLSLPQPMARNSRAVRLLWRLIRRLRPQDQQRNRRHFRLGRSRHRFWDRAPLPFNTAMKFPLERGLSFRPGLGNFCVELLEASLNWQDLVFGDQINRGVADGGATASLEGLANFQLVRNFLMWPPGASSTASGFGWARAKLAT